MTVRSRRPLRPAFQSPMAQAGQSMVEYVVILSFGVLVLIGPGGRILDAAVDVLKENQRGYAWSMSMSPMPDYDTVALYKTELQNSARGQPYTAAAVERLAVGGAALEGELMPYAGLYSRFIIGLNTAKNLTNTLVGQTQNWATSAVNAGAILPTNGLSGAVNNVGNLLCSAAPCPTPPQLPQLPRLQPPH